MSTVPPQYSRSYLPVPLGLIPPPAIGGKRVPDHTSLYRFREQGLLFTVYVEDLLLAGPADRHAEIWAKLKKEGISLEPAEDLHRFLGRSHIITTTAAAQR